MEKGLTLILSLLKSWTLETTTLQPEWIKGNGYCVWGVQYAFLAPRWTWSNWRRRSKSTRHNGGTNRAKSTVIVIVCLRWRCVALRRMQNARRTKSQDKLRRVNGNCYCGKLRLRDEAGQFGRPVKPIKHNSNSWTNFEVVVDQHEWFKKRISFFNCW